MRIKAGIQDAKGLVTEYRKSAQFRAAFLLDLLYWLSSADQHMSPWTWF